MLQGWDMALLWWDELSAADIDDWRALQASNAAYFTAHLMPEFTGLVAQTDPTTRVALIRRDGALKGVLPISLRRGGFARPVGAPFSDYSGPILSEDFDGDLRRLLAQAGLSAYRFTSSPDPYGHLSKWMGEPETGHRMIISPHMSGEDVLEMKRAEHPKAHKNFRRLRNKLEKDGVEVELRCGPSEASEVPQLLRWKQDQYAATGRLDVIAAARGQRFLQTFIDRPFDGVAGGYYAMLYYDGALVAGEFGMRVHDVFHPWIAAYDPQHQETGPGNQLMREFLLQMPGLGLRLYDLATGHNEYKKYFCNFELPVVSGLITARGAAGAWQALSNKTIRSLAVGPLASPMTRMRRRFDHIAATEMSVVKRVSEAAKAILRR